MRPLKHIKRWSRWGRFMAPLYTDCPFSWWGFKGAIRRHRNRSARSAPSAARRPSIVHWPGGSAGR